MNEIDKILENLNEQQRKAVTETEGFIRVIAGAGSGKTKALTSRYAYIVEALGINSSKNGIVNPSLPTLALDLVSDSKLFNACNELL